MLCSERLTDMALGRGILVRRGVWHKSLGKIEEAVFLQVLAQSGQAGVGGPAVPLVDQLAVLEDIEDGVSQLVMHVHCLSAQATFMGWCG